MIRREDLDEIPRDVYADALDEIQREMADALWNKMLGNPRTPARFLGIARYMEGRPPPRQRSHSCSNACHLFGCTAARTVPRPEYDLEIEAAQRVGNWRRYEWMDDYDCPAGARSGAT
jgi:hypothetical protein